MQRTLQLLFMGGWSMAKILLEFWPFFGTDGVRSSIFFSACGFFCIVPFVQIPLLKNALSRLNAQLESSPLFRFYAELEFAVGRLIDEAD
jgi:hypothetical protein